MSIWVAPVIDRNSRLVKQTLWISAWRHAQPNWPLHYKGECRQLLCEPLQVFDCIQVHGFEERVIFGVSYQRDKKSDSTLYRWEMRLEPVGSRPKFFIHIRI